MKNNYFCALIIKIKYPLYIYSSKKNNSIINFIKCHQMKINSLKKFVDKSN